MNNIQEKKLRKIIKCILEEGSYKADMFAPLEDSPGGKKLSSSSKNSSHDNKNRIRKLLSALRTMRQDIINIYGESGKDLIKMLDKIEPTNKPFVDEDPTRFVKY